MSVRTHLRPGGKTLGGQVLPGEAPCACDGPSICLIGSHPTAELQDLVDCYNEEIDRRTLGGMHNQDLVDCDNEEIDRSESQTVLRCKILDKETGENIFIVVDKNVVSQSVNP